MSISSLLVMVIIGIPVVMWARSPVALASKILLPVVLMCSILIVVAALNGNGVLGTLAAAIATLAGTAEGHLRHKRDKAEASKRPTEKEIA